MESVEDVPRRRLGVATAGERASTSPVAPPDDGPGLAPGDRLGRELAAKVR